MYGQNYISVEIVKYAQIPVIKCKDVQHKNESILIKGTGRKHVCCKFTTTN